ncbi:MAG: Glu-tRNA(Gln) amidotransferase subunit GatE [Candidatus Pacearchaeota archaeon]
MRKIRIGLEIHQQLDTRKLFCNCPSIIKEKIEPDAIIKRNLFAVASELGSIDVAALYEQEKAKNHFYYFYKDCCCLVELDEMPPFPINEEALRIAIQISLLLNAEILPLTQVMRKIVIDGSDVSGFQRTLLLAKNGWIEYEWKGNKRKLKIVSICLEEESAKKIKEEGNNVYWSLDRYGIPLIEITTEPTIENPEEAKIAALAIGEVLRACKVKRGLGTIRQDLNISVEGGARTEIKGIQEPNLIPKVIENEILYQIEKIKRNEIIKESVKKANEDGSLTFLRPLPGSARMYPETDLPLIKIDKKLIEEIRKNLPKTIEEIKNELKELENIDFIEGISRNRKKYEIYNEIIQKLKIKDIETKKFLATILINYLKEVSNELKKSEDEIIEGVGNYLLNIIEDYIKKNITKHAVKEIIKEICQGKKYIEIKENYRIYKGEELEKKILEFIKEKKIDKKYWVNECIRRFKFNAEINEIMKILKKIDKNE